MSWETLILYVYMHQTFICIFLFKGFIYIKVNVVILYVHVCKHIYIYIMVENLLILGKVFVTMENVSS